MFMFPHDTLKIELLWKPNVSTCRLFVHNLYTPLRPPTQPGDQLNTRFFLIVLGFFFNRFGVFFSPIKNLLGQTEMRTRERKEWQSIRTVLDISRDDLARTAAYRWRTATDRHI